MRFSKSSSFPAAAARRPGLAAMMRRLSRGRGIGRERVENRRSFGGRTVLRRGKSGRGRELSKFGVNNSVCRENNARPPAGHKVIPGSRGGRAEPCRDFCSCEINSGRVRESPHPGNSRDFLVASGSVTVVPAHPPELSIALGVRASCLCNVLKMNGLANIWNSPCALNAGAWREVLKWRLGTLPGLVMTFHGVDSGVPRRGAS